MTHICGVKTVIPSNPYDAKGLLIAAIEDNDPVVFLEPKRIYNGPFSGYYDRPVEPWSKHDARAVPEDYYRRSEEHTSELQSLMRNSYAVFRLTKKNTKAIPHPKTQ